MSQTTVPATVLIVPGLRDDVPDHWQTHLARRIRTARTVAPMGRENLSCAERVDALEREAAAIEGPIVLVAHSGGVLTVVHWAHHTRRAVRGALLAVPPDFEAGLPDGYPTTEELRSAGWFPVPRTKLPFPSIVAASHNDPLASFKRVVEFARQWGSRLADLGNVRHLNPAAGFGEWPGAEPLIAELDASAVASARIA
jgi:predicted alpha/beta hydrolase family esterase